MSPNSPDLRDPNSSSQMPNSRPPAQVTPVPAIPAVFPGSGLTAGIKIVQKLLRRALIVIQNGTCILAKCRARGSRTTAACTPPPSITRGNPIRYHRLVNDWGSRRWSQYVLYAHSRCMGMITIRISNGHPVPIIDAVAIQNITWPGEDMKIPGHAINTLAV